MIYRFCVDDQLDLHLNNKVLKYFNQNTFKAFTAMRWLCGLLVFSAWNATVSSITLECVFQVSARKLYACVNTNIDIPGNGIRIEDVSGVHEPDRDSDHVREIFFLSSAMRSLPQNVFEVFPYLSRYLVHGVDIQGI